jgi:hypothetical protein
MQIKHLSTFPLRASWNEFVQIQMDASLHSFIIGVAYEGYTWSK